MIPVNNGIIIVERLNSPSIYNPFNLSSSVCPVSSYVRYKRTRKKAFTAKPITIAVKINACGKASVNTVDPFPVNGASPVFKPPSVISNKWTACDNTEDPKINRNIFLDNIKYVPTVTRTPDKIIINVSIHPHPYQYSK